MMNQAEQKELIQLLKDSLEQYKETNQYFKKQNEEQQKQIQQLTQVIANLNETVEYLKNKIFGSSSQKQKSNDVIPGQQSLFNEVEAHVDPSAEEPTVENVLEGTHKKPRKKKMTRKELLDKLPVVEVVCQLAPEDKLCSYCNTEMTVLGKKLVREELRITPAKVERIRYIQETLMCPQCKEDDEPVLKTATAPSPLLKHSLASPSTVAHVMYQKYVNALPLY